MDRLEKKIIQVKKVRISGVTYEIKRCTPEDFLGKEGIPISKWQSEADFIASKEKSSSLTLPELKELWRKLFNKAIVSANGRTENLPVVIDMLVDNYFVSNKLYAEIMDHCLQLKKKTLFQRLFRKTLG